jgi:two-component system, OmpR family, KDP operon response regulator KdpE
MTTVLVVDDEPQIRRALQTSLLARDHDVIVAGRGEEALSLAASRAPDLVVLDLGLPDLDGVEVIRRLRAWSEVPVLVLTVREEQTQKITALDAGADDYVTKPFDVDEVLARMRAMLRRIPHEEDDAPTLRFEELEIDLARRLVLVDGEILHLTPTEYALLEAMVRNQGKLLTHQWLLRRVWGPGYGAENHYLHVFIRQLRQKLGDDAALPRFIITEPGVGYRWSPEPSPGRGSAARRGPDVDEPAARSRP